MESWGEQLTWLNCNKAYLSLHLQVHIANETYWKYKARSVDRIACSKILIVAR